MPKGEVFAIGVWPDGTVWLSDGSEPAAGKYTLQQVTADGVSAIEIADVGQGTSYESVQALRYSAARAEMLVSASAFVASVDATGAIGKQYVSAELGTPTGIVTLSNKLVVLGSSSEHGAELDGVVVVDLDMGTVVRQTDATECGCVDNVALFPIPSNDDSDNNNDENNNSDNNENHNNNNNNNNAPNPVSSNGQSMNEDEDNAASQSIIGLTSILFATTFTLLI